MKACYGLRAPAKLNLFLHVVGKRPDGYHLLESLFVPIDWYDTLHLERRSDGRLQRHDLGTPLPEDDLCPRCSLHPCNGMPPRRRSSWSSRLPMRPPSSASRRFRAGCHEAHRPYPLA